MNLTHQRDGVILDQVILLHPQDDKTNYILGFEVPAGVQKLRFTCSYSPKTVEDAELAKRAARCSIGRYVPRWQLPLYEERESEEIKLVNLITLSLDCGEDYLGCAHRQAPEQEHVLSAEMSSPGFVRHTPRAGQYRAVLNVHSITSPQVAYRLLVTAEGGQGA